MKRDKKEEEDIDDDEQSDGQRPFKTSLRANRDGPRPEDDEKKDDNDDDEKSGSGISHKVKEDRNGLPK